MTFGDDLHAAYQAYEPYSCVAREVETQLRANFPQLRTHKGIRFVVRVDDGLKDKMVHKAICEHLGLPIEGFEHYIEISEVQHPLPARVVSVTVNKY